MVTRSTDARKLRNYLINKYGPVCQICVAFKRTGKVTLIDLTIENGPLSYSVDHVIALADGGSDTRDNKQPAHRLCNSVKGSKADNRLHTMPKMPRSNIKRKRHTSRGPRLAYSSVSPEFDKHKIAS